VPSEDRLTSLLLAKLIGMPPWMFDAPVKAVCPPLSLQMDIVRDAREAKPQQPLLSWEAQIHKKDRPRLVDWTSSLTRRNCKMDWPDGRGCPGRPRRAQSTSGRPRIIT